MIKQTNNITQGLRGEAYTSREIEQETISFNLDEAEFNLINVMARQKQKENKIR